MFPPEGDVVDHLPAVGDEALEDLAHHFLAFSPLRPRAVLALEPAAEESQPTASPRLLPHVLSGHPPWLDLGTHQCLFGNDDSEDESSKRMFWSGAVIA